MVMDYGIGFTWDHNLTHNKLLAAAEEAQAIARAAGEAAEEARLAAEDAEKAADQARDLAEQAADTAEQANEAARQLAEAVAEVRELAVQAGESADNAAAAAAQNATDIEAVDNALDAHIADKAAGVHGAAIAATANTIAMRGTGGTLNVGTPTAATHAVTKTYVDAGIGDVLIVANAAAQAAESAALTAAWTGITDKPSTYPPSAHTHGNATITDIDASKIISGTIDIARLPAGALDRLKIVSTDAARYALTKADVQTGDTVQVTDTKIMYRVVDDSKLSTAAGYVEYTAARASAVPWSGVTDKPSDFAPAKHAAMHKTGGNDAIAPADIGAAAISHTTPVATASATGHVKPGTGLSVDAAGALAVKYGTAAGTACQGNDSRLSNARTPTEHAATHAPGGTDPLNFTDIGAAPGSITLTDATAGNALPATTSSTLAALLQTTRNCLKWLVARFDASGKALTAVSADSAVKWTTGRTLTLTGAVTGSATGVDGSGNISITTSAASGGVAPVKHAATHKTGGTDALSPADIGAVKVSGDTMTGNLTMNNNSLFQFANSTTNPKINLYSDMYAIGIQGNTLYFRAAANAVFRFYKGGTHQATAGAGTGGAEILTLDSGSAVFSGSVAATAVKTSGNIVSKNAAGTSQSVVAPTYADTPWISVKNLLATGLHNSGIRFQSTRADGTPQSTGTYIQALCDLVNNPVKDTPSDSALMIRSAGMLYCGSGESASGVRAAASGATAIPSGWALFTAKVFDDSEHAFFSSDGNLYLIANANTIANSKMLRFDTAGHLLPGQNNAQDLGSPTYKFRNVHGTTFQGNALTATKLAAAKTISLTGAVTGSVSTDLAGNASIATTGNAAGLGFTQSLANNGYTKLPNGLILQWGRDISGSRRGEGEYTISFPVAFTSACYMAMGAISNADKNKRVDYDCQTVTFTATTVTFFLQCSSYEESTTMTAPYGFYWFAIGK